jgi:predicted permease
MFESIWRDFLYAFRVLFKRPLPTVLATLALSLSIGLTTSTFSVYNGLLFKSLPYPNGDRVYRLIGGSAETGYRELTVPEDLMLEIDAGIVALGEDKVPMEASLGYYTGTFNVSGDGKRAERYNGAFVCGSLTTLTGVEMQLGQDLSELPEEEAQTSVLLSHQVWIDRYGQDPDVIGREILVNGATLRVAGVLPEGFSFPYREEIWALTSSPANSISHTDTGLLISILGREGSSTREMEKVIKQVANAVAEQRGETDDGDYMLVPFGQFIEQIAQNPFWLFAQILIVVVIFLIACANVANLLLGRASTRGHEMAIRSAMGATRIRLIRQLLTESLVLAFLGCVGALLYTAWTMDMDAKVVSEGFPAWLDFGIDWRVFVFTAGILVITALASGVLPALQASRTDFNEMLKETNRTATSFRVTRLSRILTVGQIALSCALLFAAGLVARYIHQMEEIDAPFEPEKVLTLRMGIFASEVPPPGELHPFYTALLEKVEAIPGTRDAALTSWISVPHKNFIGYRIVPENGSTIAASDSVLDDQFERVSENYFETLDAQFVAGHNFTLGDRYDPFAIVVNESFAVENFGSPSKALGRKLEFSWGEGKMELGESPFRIVGVVTDLPFGGLGTELGDPTPILYLPAESTHANFMTLVVRSTEGDANRLMDPIRDVIHELDPHIPPYFERTLQEFYDQQLLPFRMFVRLFVFVAAMALFLAAVGIYGLMTFSVSVRRQEFGVRMALGASRIQLVQMVLRQGLVQLGLGVILGLGFAITFGRLLGHIFQDLDPIDLTTFSIVLLTLTVSTLLALALPLRRTARLSPMEALRYE